MKRFVYIITVCLWMMACQDAIKNPEAEVLIEEGVDTTPEVISTVDSILPIIEHEESVITENLDSLPIIVSEQKEYPLGYWIGIFSASDGGENFLFVDEGFLEQRK